MKDSNISKYYKTLSIFLFLYLSLVFGFYVDENLNFGAIGDWLHTDKPVIEALSVDIKKTLLTYEDFGHRHSPLYLIFLSFFHKLGLSLDSIRFLHLNLSIFLVYYFYKCLTLKFEKIDKNLLLLISFSLFLSPTFRSLSIWPSTRIIGLIFFVISIYEFLKYQKFSKEKYIFKNLLFLILSSYISPNFSVFVIYFFFHYIKKENLILIIKYLIFCGILSLPAFYYLIILDINFLTATTPGSSNEEKIGLSLNFANKILIISSIILFHLSPFLLNKSIFSEFKKIKNFNLFVFLIIFLICLFYFDYIPNYTGGGVFFQISYHFFNNNYFFYFVSLVSIFILCFFSYKNLNNFLIFFILIISNIQNTIYHKYYDPLVLIIFFTIISNYLVENFFIKKNNIYYLYTFYIGFICLRLVKNYIYI